MYLGDTAPTDGTQFWFNTVDNRLYVDDDGVWVDASPQVPQETFSGDYNDLTNLPTLIDLGKFKIDTNSGTAILTTIRESGFSYGYDIAIVPSGEGNNIYIPNQANAILGQPISISANANSAVTISTNNAEWKFGTDGILKFPVGEVAIGTNPDTQVTYFGAGVDGGGSISFSTTGNTYIVGSQNTVIDAGFGNDAPTKHWTFGADGVLTMPDGNLGGNGAINFNWEGNNWASISSSESTLNLYSLSVVNGNPKTNVRIGDNVELTTNLLDSAYTWTFGAGGGLEFPAGYILPTTLGAPGQVITLGGQGGTYWESPLSIGNTIPALQNFWYNTNDGRLYVKANDVWVDANPQVPQETFSGDYNDLTNLPDTGPFDRLIAGDKSVILDTDGVLTLPANIVGNSVIYSSTGNVELYTNHSGDASVKIRAKGDAGDSVWSFRSDGAITLPAYGTINSIDGIKLVTDRGTLAIGTQLEGIGVPQHFHIAFDGSNITPPFNDLFLGDDYNYVKLPKNTELGVTIGTHNRSGGNHYNWAFGTDGVLRMPDGDLGSDGRIDFSFEGYNWARIRSHNRQVYLESILDNGPSDPDTGNILTQLSVGLDTLIITDWSGAQHTWNFGLDGTLTFPDSTIQTTAWQGSTIISDTAPVNALGRLWYNLIDGRTYVKYSGVWVDANPEVPQRVPTDISELTDDLGLLNFTGGVTSYNDLTDLPTLFSGDYNDLTNKPTIPNAYTLPTATSSVLGGVKIGSNVSITDGVISVAAPFSGSYTDLTNKPTIPSLTGYATLTGEETLTNKTLTSPTITDGVFQTSFTIGNQVFYEHGYNGFSVNENWDIVGESNFTGYHYTSGAGRDGVAFTLARTGQFTDGFGIHGTASGNEFVIGSETGNTDFVFKKSIGMPFDVSGGTTIFKIGRDGSLTFADDTTQTTAWTGSVAYASVTGTPTLATVATSGSYADLSNKPTIPTTVTVNGTSITLGSSGTVTADASTLTGTTLKSTITSSSLTSVGNNLTVPATYGNIYLTQYASVFVDGSSTNNIVQVSSNDRTNGIALWSTGGTPRIYSAGGIDIRTGVTLRDRDTPTGGVTKISIASDGTATFTNTITGSISGNAATATSAATLTTARNINGVAFDGSAAITIKATATNALTIGTGLSGTSYDGSSAVSITLATGYGDTQNPYANKTANYFLAAPNGSTGAPTFRAIVAADIPTLNQNTSGSAATLTTARTINGVSFNGSANINVPTLTDGTNSMKITAVPSTLNGASGDVVGSVAFDSSYIYYCYQAYTGATYNLQVNSGGATATVNVYAGNPLYTQLAANFLTNGVGWTFNGAPITNIVTSGTYSVNITMSSGYSSVTNLQTFALVQPALSANWKQTPWGAITSSGNAATATKLATARAINGTNFDGSADITITAAAGTLTGTTLNATVVSSSLTSVGTLTSLAVTNSSSSPVNVTYTPASTTGQAILATGKDTQGGTGYFDFLKVTNTTSSVTNGNKTFRLSSTGAVEIVNSAYSSTLLILSNTGNLSISGDYQVSGKKAVNGPAFRAYVSTDQTLSSGSQLTVTFGTENFDTDNCFTSNTFTPTVEGYYQLNATVRISGGSSTGEVMIVLYKNSNEYARGTNEGGTEQGASWYSMQVSDIAYANGTTDSFHVRIQQTSGSNKTTTSGSAISYFSGCMIRGA